MVVLLVGFLKEASGNKSTLQRIKKYFENCLLEDCNSFEDHNQLESFIICNKVSIIFALHAFHSGKLFTNGCSVPFSIIIGGTDINTFSKSHYSNKIMEKALSNSKCIIVFSEWLKTACIQLWPELKIKEFFKICQAVPDESPDIISSQTYISKLHQHSLPSSINCPVFTMVTGLRIEKDPLFLLDSFQKWSGMHYKSCVLLIIGAQTNKEFSKSFLERLKKYHSVKYLGSMPKCQVDAIVSRSVGVVNSSRSEGMCQSILDSMSLGVPVVARDIPGNRALITHRHNGLLYSTPEECMEHFETLLQDEALRQTLIHNATKRLCEDHSEELEGQRYNAVVKFMQSTSENFDDFP